MRCKFRVVHLESTRAFDKEADAWIPAVRLVLESAAHQDAVCGKSGDPGRTILGKDGSESPDPTAAGLPGADEGGHYKPCQLPPGHKGVCALKAPRPAHAEAADPLFHNSAPKGLVDVTVTRPQEVLECSKLQVGATVVLEFSWGGMA